MRTTVARLHHHRRPGRRLAQFDHRRLRRGDHREVLAGAEVAVLPAEHGRAGQRGERQPLPGRQGPGQQLESAARRLPARTGPAGAPPGRGEGQGPRADPVLVDAGVQLGVGQAERSRERPGVTLGLLAGLRAAEQRIRQQLRMPPERLAVSAPDHPDLPAWAALARVPATLAVLDEAAGRERVGQQAGELDGEVVLAAALGRDRPLGRGRLGAEHEGGLAAHGQLESGGREALVHLLPEAAHGRSPLLRGDTRLVRFAEAVHGVRVRQARLGRARGAGDRRGVRRAGGRRKRDVSLPGEQRRRGVEPDPAGAGQVDLGPGVQIGTVLAGVIAEIDQIPRHEPGGESEVPQCRDHQPGRVPAGADSAGQRVRRGLDSGLHPGGVADGRVRGGVEVDQEVDRRSRAGVDPGQPGSDGGFDRALRRPGGQVGLQVGPQLIGIVEAAFGRVRLDEEVERIDRRQPRYQSDGDVQLAGRLLEHHPGHEVAVRILLPVQLVLGRRDLEGITRDGGPAVRRRPQPDQVRPELGRPVEPVGGSVLQRDVDAHPTPFVRSGHDHSTGPE